MEPFVTIEIHPIDDSPYDPTEILKEFIRAFDSDPSMRKSGSCFILIREIGGDKFNLGFFRLTSNCPLVRNLELSCCCTPAMDLQPK